MNRPSGPTELAHLCDPEMIPDAFEQMEALCWALQAVDGKPRHRALLIDLGINYASHWQHTARSVMQGIDEALGQPRAQRRERVDLPIEQPRSSWAELLDRAAEALEGHGHRTADPDTLPLELRAIAEALRAEVRA